MADPYLASNEFPGDGVTTLYNVSFKGNRPDAGSGVVPYLNPADVKAQVVTPATSTTAEVVVDVPIVYVGPNQFRVTPATPVGKITRIYRATQDEYALVDYQALQTVGEADLDLSNRQTIFVVQEAHDLAQRASVTSTDAAAIAASAVTVAQGAVTTANDATSAAATAVSTAQGAVTIANNAATTAGNAVSTAADAVSTANAASATATTALNTANSVLGVAEDAVDTATNAVNIANAANDTANGIEAKADQALATSSSAVDIANAATATANGIDAKAQDALDTADAANSTASTANATANSAVSTANGAVTTANTANATANAIDGKATTALSNSTTAVNTANSALTAANAAVKTFNGRAPTSGAINPASGDYTLAMITGGTDASNLTSGTLNAARLSGTYAINVTSATRWTTGRTITLGGGLAGNVTMDGTANVTLTGYPTYSVVGLSTFYNGWVNQIGARYAAVAIAQGGSRVDLQGQVAHAYPQPVNTLIANIPAPSFNRRFACAAFSSGGLFIGIVSVEARTDTGLYYIAASVDPSSGNGIIVVDLSTISYFTAV